MNENQPQPNKLALIATLIGQVGVLLMCLVGLAFFGALIWIILHL